MTAQGTFPTLEEVVAARTPAGGYTRETLTGWGVPWPPPKGWLAALADRAGTPPLQRPCPTCEAVEGQPCLGKYGKERKSLHRARGSRRRTYKPRPAPELKTESPIESALVGFILGWLDHHGGEASVTSQAPIGPYRADILVQRDDRKLVVECDGADYHGSPERVQRDKRRDRYCAARGIHVMRFSGSEITRDPRGCAGEVGMWIRLR